MENIIILLSLNLVIHLMLIFSLVYIMMEVIPNSLLFDRLYPKLIIFCFRMLIGFTSFMVFINMLETRYIRRSELLLHVCIAFISVMVSWYSPRLNRILKHELKEKIAKPQPGEPKETLTA